MKTNRRENGRRGEEEGEGEWRKGRVAVEVKGRKWSKGEERKGIQ